ncbi:hypothetical protein OSTOST_10513, partial [Ostertagia ostertagi]
MKRDTDSLEDRAVWAREQTCNIVEKDTVQTPPPPQPYWNWAPPTVNPVVPSPVTPPPVDITRASPQLLAHNTARMIREIATFSDVHHGANDDYGAVQTIMEAFFQSLADPQPAAAAQ